MLAAVVGNGVWRNQANRADVLFSDEEVWMLSRIDAEQQDPGLLRTSLTITEQEMRCQRDMRVRGHRLWAYHQRLGDLADFGLSVLGKA